MYQIFFSQVDFTLVIASIYPHLLVRPFDIQNHLRQCSWVLPEVVQAHAGIASSVAWRPGADAAIS